MLKKLSLDIDRGSNMNKDEIFRLAENYMKNTKVDVVLPGEIGETNGDKIEVIFLNPFTLDPDSIVCPPDYRLWVNVRTKEVTWIEQM